MSERASLSVAGRTSLAALIDRYLLEITPRKRAQQSERSHLGIVKKHLGQVSVAALSAPMVLAYVDTRYGEGVGADSVRKELHKLSVVIDAGIALWGVNIPANPVTIVKSVLRVTKALPAGARRDRRPTLAELALLYQSHIGPLIEFAVETAMRRGELAAMRWADVGLDERVLHIPLTKTDRARTIPLSTRARAILATLPRDGASVWGVRPDSITQAFRRACAAAGVVGLRLHDLRHEGTSRLFERGLSIQEVALITGHEDWDSLKRYTHLCPLAVGLKLA